MGLGDRILGRSANADSFAGERETLADDIARMGGLVERSTTSALDAVARRDTQLAQTLISQRDEFGRMQAQLEHDVVRMIAVWRPLTREVNELIGALKISAHLARIGELSCNVARRAVALNAAEPMVLVRSIERMGLRVAALLHSALDAYAQQDPTIAADAWGRDDDVDDAYHSLFKELMAFIADDPSMTGPCTHMMLIAKDLERIGDRATDIAQIAYTLVTGADVAQGGHDEPGR